MKQSKESIEGQMSFDDIPAHAATPHAEHMARLLASVADKDRASDEFVDGRSYHTDGLVVASRVDGVSIEQVKNRAEVRVDRIAALFEEGKGFLPHTHRERNTAAKLGADSGSIVVAVANHLEAIRGHQAKPEVKSQNPELAVIAVTSAMREWRTSALVSQTRLGNLAEELNAHSNPNTSAALFAGSAGAAELVHFVDILTYAQRQGQPEEGEVNVFAERLAPVNEWAPPDDPIKVHVREVLGTFTVGRGRQAVQLALRSEANRAEFWDV